MTRRSPPEFPPAGSAVEVVSASDVAHTRRAAQAVAVGLRFPADDQARVALVATEMATNLVKYGVDGRVYISVVPGPGGPGLELLAVDRGPGMADVGAALVDGYSTTGSLGGGLGAILRQSDGFDLHTTPGRGTVVLARLWIRSDGADDPAMEFEIGGVNIPAPGQEVSGDAWAAEQRGRRLAVLTVDGLGHGPDAHKAARGAVRLFHQLHRDPVETIVAGIHAALRPTRGAAVAVVEIDAAAATARLCGLGNVRGLLIGASGRREMLSDLGIAGHRASHIRASEYACPPGTLVVLHSDGITTRWSLADYPGLASRHPALVSAVIARDHRRGPDDACVVAARARPSP